MMMQVRTNQLFNAIIWTLNLKWGDRAVILIDSRLRIEEFSFFYKSLVHFHSLQMNSTRSVSENTEHPYKQDIEECTSACLHV